MNLSRVVGARRHGLFVDASTAQIYRCMICSDIPFPSTALALSDCGHLLCCECKETFRRPSHCPLCKEAWSTLQPVADRHKLIYRALYQLTTYCSSRMEEDVGGILPLSPKLMCKWRGPWKDLEAHTLECDHVFAKCKFNDKGCKYMCPRNKMPKHTKDCVYREIECPDCKITLLQTFLADHKANNCPQGTVTCPHCESSKKREALESHIAACPWMIVNCPVPSCSYVRPRFELLAHMDDSAGQHVELLCKEVAALKLQLSSYSTDLEINNISTLVDVWESRHFSLMGYKWFARVHTRGYGQKGTHLAVFLCCASEVVGYNMNVHCTVTLLNQLDPKRNIIKGELLSLRPSGSHGFPTFCTLQEIKNTHGGYVVGDCVRLVVTLRDAVRVSGGFNAGK